MVYYIIVLLAGVLCAGIGGELFVRGIVGLARWAGISAGIIGATVAAFGTSSPELSVAVNAALAGDPEISLGDALGSNISNIALILGLTLLISGIHAPRDSVKRDFPVAVLAPAIIGFLALDGTVSRSDGLLLLVIFVAWLVAIIREVRRQRDATAEVLGERRGRKAFALCVLGLAFLVAAGRFMVGGAKGIVTAFGIDEFIIGATLVAFGTSIPELATTIISKIRGHDEVGLETVLGSNIFNSFFIIAVAAVITPIHVDWGEVAIALLFGLVSVLLTYPDRTGFIHSWRGILLLMLYAAYIAVMGGR